MDSTMDTDARPVILAVDDEKTNLALLNRILSPEYTLLTAKSGQEALERVAGKSPELMPDLILLDIVMPGMDGFETLRKLKDNPDTQHVPVIFITGLSSAEDEEKGLNLGALDYITKPFREAIVRARVRNHIALARHMRLIERLGLVDPLTDIANRRSFDEQMAREWKTALRDQKPLALLMMDVDKFKTYNDTYGHPQGDALLKALARVFQSAVRRPRDLAARIGGEEFAVLLPDTELAAALEIAEIIRHKVEAARIPTLDHRQETSATLSIGAVSLLPTPDDTPQTLMKQADERLYAAKTGGRNRVVGDAPG
ncbi:MAG: diguanylate cyclase [Candidatus Accumulibacter sp.]|nr:diguanylate cyclase [Accumulibacter sp.]